jgi:hypothetical protein
MHGGLLDWKAARGFCRDVGVVKKVQHGVKGILYLSSHVDHTVARRVPPTAPCWPIDTAWASSHRAWVLSPC